MTSLFNHAEVSLKGCWRFCKWYFKLISMSGRRRLQFDRDQQSFPPHALLHSFQNTPESLTFDAVSESKSRKRLKGSREAKTIKITYNEHSAAEVTYSPSLQSHYDLSSQRTLMPQTIPGHRRSSLLGLSGEQERSLDRQLDQMHQKITDTKAGTCKLIFENNNILEGIIRSQKIKKLKDMFIKKIRRTSTAATPVHFDLLSATEGESILAGKGVEVPQGLSNFLNLLSVVQILCLLFIYSVSIAFQDLISENRLLSTLQMGSLLFYLLEIGLNLVSIKSQAGKKVEVIEQIIHYYMGRSFWVDVMSFIILLLDITTSVNGMSYLRLFIVFKLPACLGKVEKLEVHFIRNIYNEQYWGLAKVFLVNFCMAHVICILLAGMTHIDQTNNWMVTKGVANAEWTQRYIWSYYWAANIMLTVGFGDIVASNSTEAICLIFIETFSCIVMAYNINCMGAILTSIRAENERRSKKFKIFKKLTTNNYVPEELQFQINNYIEESSNLKKKFNHEEDKEFISQLPRTLRVSYLREANRTVLGNLVFFKDLLDRTLYNFAEHLEVRMTHPQETIRHINDDFNLMILKEGEIGYSCRKHGCGFNDEIVDYIRVRAGETPFLTSLDFISKLRPLYEIKSLKFSVLYQLDYSRFIEVFRESDMDYELFCFLRDKIRNIPDEFEVLPCEYCGKKFNHFKFTCPKLHYTPYPQHIIHKELHREKIGQNARTKMKRAKETLLTPLEFYKKLKNYRSSPKVGVQYDQRLFYKNIYREGVKKVEQRNSTLMSGDGRRGTQLPEELCQEDLHDLINIMAKEAIQVQFLRKQQMEEFQDELWMLKVDVLADFNSYFSQNNPSLLREKFTPEKRIHQKMEKMYNLERAQHPLGVPQVGTDAINNLIGYTPSDNDSAPE